MSTQILNSAVSAFTGFINREFKNDITGFDKNSIFVFIHRITAPQVKLHKLVADHERILHFSEPSEDYSFTAVDSLKVINEQGDGRIEAAGKKIKSLREKIITNNPDMLDNIPLFTGAVKFMSDKSNQIWKDFGDCYWFIPENIIFRKSDEFYFIHNFILNNQNGVEKNIELFQIKFGKILFNSAEECSKGVKLKHISGNSLKDRKKWLRNIERALQMIESGNLQKVVLSRKIEVVFDKEPDPDWLLGELKKKYPDCIHFYYHSGKSSFLGATPETLMKIKNGELTLDVLAGSASVQLKTADTELKSEKNITEHKYVTAHIRETLNEFTTDFQVSGIQTRQLPNILHLYSRVSAKLLPGFNIFSVLKELFPTPAVAGYPKQQALQLIKKIEDGERGLYSGFIGWLNHNQEGHFIVTIRSGLLQENKMQLYAGAGIVHQSVPEEEFMETEMKLESLLSVLNNENKNK